MSFITNDRSFAFSFSWRNVRRKFADVLFPEGVCERDELRRAAETDALTGLANRRALERALPAVESDPAWAVIVFDMNFFKSVNDLLNHVEGDKLLVEFASCIRRVAEAFGCGERVFRYGGDEFVILSPACFAKSVRRQVEAVCGTTEIKGVDAQTGLRKRVTVSISGEIGDTFLDADARLRARKAERKKESAGN